MSRLPRHGWRREAIVQMLNLAMTLHTTDWYANYFLLPPQNLKSDFIFAVSITRIAAGRGVGVEPVSDSARTEADWSWSRQTWSDKQQVGGTLNLYLYFYLYPHLYLHLHYHLYLYLNSYLYNQLHFYMHLSKCHSIRHKTPKFPTPPKSYATIFFGLLRTPYWSN